MRVFYCPTIDPVVTSGDCSGDCTTIDATLTVVGQYFGPDDGEVTLVGSHSITDGVRISCTHDSSTPHTKMTCTGFQGSGTGVDITFFRRDGAPDYTRPDSFNFIGE